MVGSGRGAYFLQGKVGAGGLPAQHSLTIHNISVYRAPAGAHFDFKSWTGEGGESYSISVENGVIRTTRLRAILPINLDSKGLSLRLEDCLGPGDFPRRIPVFHRISTASPELASIFNQVIAENQVSKPHSLWSSSQLATTSRAFRKPSSFRHSDL